MVERLEIIEGICHIRHRGGYTLVEAVELVSKAIAYCRERNISKLLFDGRGLVGPSVPSLVDRFLMVEEWAREARSMVAMALVVEAKYIHPHKFGVKVAGDFGFMADVYDSEAAALQWLSSGGRSEYNLPEC